MALNCRRSVKCRTSAPVSVYYRKFSLKSVQLKSDMIGQQEDSFFGEEAVGKNFLNKM